MSIGPRQTGRWSRTCDGSIKEVIMNRENTGISLKKRETICDEMRVGVRALDSDEIGIVGGGFAPIVIGFHLGRFAAPYIGKGIGWAAAGFAGGFGAAAGHDAYSRIQRR